MTIITIKQASVCDCWPMLDYRFNFVTTYVWLMLLWKHQMFRLDVTYFVNGDRKRASCQREKEESI